jgi:UDP-glucose 4-epimerase
MSHESQQEPDAPPSPHFDDTVVLVTGGAGLVGSRLVDALTPATEVRVLDHFETSDPSAMPDAVEVYQGDVGTRALVDRAIDGVDVVLHQAATSGPYAREDPVESHRVNVTATLRLLEAARGADARVVVASSAAIYGRTTTPSISEDAPTTPTVPYGVQKLAADEYTRLYHRLYGLETVVLRYFNVYGYRPETSRRKSVVNVFVESARKGDELRITGDGSQVRDFVHVDDVVRATLRAAVTPHVGEAFNVGTGTGTSIERLAALVQERAPTVSVTKAEKRKGDVDVSVADVTKARTRLGYDPLVPVEDGVERLWESYRHRENGPT